MGYILKEIVKDPEIAEKIEERCGKDPIGDGLECPHCGAPECWKPKDENPNKGSNRWWFMIRAFRVDDASECKNCGEWFGL